jgi:hypothetical protein
MKISNKTILNVIKNTWNGDFLVHYGRYDITSAAIKKLLDLLIFS